MSDWWSSPRQPPGAIPFRSKFDAARDPLTARNALGAVDAKFVTDAIAAAGGGGGGAPTTAQYVTAATDATLTAERVLTNTATVTWDFTTAGQAKANTAAGGGNVSNSGTPTVGQYAKWVTATTIQGVAPATVLSDIGAQPLDADLTAIAALTGTNTIYYRSAANTWAAVTIGTGLTFTGGTLAATGGGGGGNVSNSGTPTAGQMAQWVTATTIKGVAISQVIQKFTASGTYTPSAGMVNCIIECVGGGGGGGAIAGVAAVLQSAGGGGSGGYSRKLATAADIGASKTVTIGAAGLGGVYTVSAGIGSGGGDTSVGSLCIAKGAPAQTAWHIGGAGGIAGTGDVTAVGAPGSGGFYGGTAANIFSACGEGGSSIFGGGAPSVGWAASTASIGGTAASNYGSGGSGASANNTAAGPGGGNGSAGIVIITELCIS